MIEPFCQRRRESSPKGRPFDHQHHRRHPAPPEIRGRVTHRADVQPKPRPVREALERRHGTSGRGLASQPRQRTPQQPVQAAAVLRRYGVQGAAAVQLHHTDPGSLSSRPASPAPNAAASASAWRGEDEPQDLRQQAPEQPEPGGFPGVAADGVAEGPEGPGVVRGRVVLGGAGRRHRTFAGCSRLRSPLPLCSPR